MTGEKVLFLSDIAPNLALMKLASWEISRGNEVYLKYGNPDRIYISNVFDKSKQQSIFSNGAEIIRGGRAEDPLACLPDHIEHMRPYYDLYGLDCSMGFTSRGCIRRCPFCDNWLREGSIRDHAPISEWWDPDHKKLIILDNNFLASPNWLENLIFIQEHKLKVNFHQGLDIRLVDEERALHLSKIKIGNFKGTNNSIHFAFDDLLYADDVVKGVDTLNAAGIKPSRLYFYMIVGFWTRDILYDLKRIRILKELGVDPFVMCYRDATALQQKLARWINKTFIWRRGEFSDYEHLTLKEKAVVGEALTRLYAE